MRSILALAIVRSSNHKAKEGKFDHCRTKAKSMPVPRRGTPSTSPGYIFIDRAPFNRGVLEFGHESVIDFHSLD